MQATGFGTRECKYANLPDQNLQNAGSCSKLSEAGLAPHGRLPQFAKLPLQ